MKQYNTRGSMCYNMALIVLIGLTGYVLFHIWTHANIFHFDTGGQVASAHFFATQGPGVFNPQWFLGMVNNLFYPPLQDIIVGSVARITQRPTLTIFIGYMSVLLLTYTTLLILIGRSYHTTRARAVYMISIIGFLLLHKPSLIFFQGLSYVDIMYTGLISEFLGGIWLLLFLYEYLNRHRRGHMALRTGLGLLSHIVTGAIPLGIMILAAIKKKSYHYILMIIVSLMIGGMFLIPMITQLGYMTNGTVVNQFPPWLMIIIVTAIILLRKKPHRSVIAIGALGLALPNIIYQMSGDIGTQLQQLLPEFHYSRYAIISLLLTIIAWAKLIDEYASYRTVYQSLIGLTIGSVIVGASYSLSTIRPRTITQNRMEKPSHTITNSESLKVPDDQRLLVIDTMRAVDFSVGSFLQHRLTNPPAMVKGLFRESSSSNLLLSSYLATLLSPNDIVLPYFYHYGLPCDQYASLWDYFIREYAIGGLLIAQESSLGYVSDSNRVCLIQMITQQQTHQYYIQFVDTITINNHPYTYYHLQTKGTRSNSIVEAVPSIERQQVTHENHTNAAQQTITHHYNNISTQAPTTTTTLFYDKPIQYNQGHTSLYSDTITGSITHTGITIEQTNTQTRYITNHNDTPTNIRVKFNYYPGRKSYDTDTQKELPIIPLRNGFVTTIDKHTTITYTQPQGWWRGQRSTVIGIIIALAWTRRRKHTILNYITRGGIAAGTDLFILYFLVEARSVGYMIAATIAFIITLIGGYIAHKYFTFQSTDTPRNRSQDMRYFLIFIQRQLIGMGVYLAMVRIGTEHLQQHYIISAIIGKVVIFIRNFYMNRYHNFNNSK